MLPMLGNPFGPHALSNVAMTSLQTLRCRAWACHSQGKSGAPGSRRTLPSCSGPRTRVAAVIQLEEAAGRRTAPMTTTWSGSHLLSLPPISIVTQLETRLPEEWLADSELWNHSNFASTDLERSRWHSGNGFIHRLPLLSGQQGDGCLSIGASDRSFRPEDQFAAQQAAGAGGRHFGAVQFGPRTELHWRRPDHLHPVPGPVWPDAGSHHRQAGCHVNQQCSDETLGHPVAWYHVLGRLGLNGWLIQIGHDQREAK